MASSGSCLLASWPWQNNFRCPIWDSGFYGVGAETRGPLALGAKKNQTKLPSVWAEKIGGGNRIVFGGGVVDSVGTRIDPSATRDDSGGTRIESG